MLEKVKKITIPSIEYFSSFIISLDIRYIMYDVNSKITILNILNTIIFSEKNNIDAIKI